MTLSLSSSAVLEAFLSRSLLRRERILAVTRAALGVLMVVRTLSVNRRELADRRLSDWLVLGVALVSCGVAIWVLRRVREERPLSRRSMYGLTTLDSLLMFSAILPLALWPGRAHGGVLGHFATSGLLLVLMTSGIRLSRGLALYSTALNGGLLVALTGVDAVLNAPPTAKEVSLAFLLFGGAALLAVLQAFHGRWLVFDGAKAVLNAERARAALGAYTSDEVAEAALGDGHPRVGGRRQEVAVLFSDLRGFTRYAEQLPPEQLVAELNEYLDEMAQVIHAHGGVVDKYIGDGIMAVFGMPAPLAEDAVRALGAAEGMSQALLRINGRRVLRGLPPLAHGIGLHWGEAIVGNVGSAEKLQYTVVGNVANLASRLEGVTKELRVEVLASADLVARARDTEGMGPLPRLFPQGTVAVRGITQPIEVYSLGASGGNEQPAGSEPTARLRA